MKSGAKRKDKKDVGVKPKERLKKERIKTAQ